MNQPLQNALLARFDSETIQLPIDSAKSQTKVCRPKRESNHGKGPHLTTETQALLRLRLRAAALILLLGFCVFLVWHIVSVSTVEPLSPFLFGFHILVLLVLGYYTAKLFQRRPIEIRKLRI